MQDPVPAHDDHSRLLRCLGVPQDTVRNVVLTHDIVPRAFGCDYTPVAAMLRQLFTAHVGLRRDERSIMYHFVGRLCVLQPDSSLAWVRPHEASHPLLPVGPGLYELVEPAIMARTRELALRSIDALEGLLADVSDGYVAAAAACGGADGFGFLPSAGAARRRRSVGVAAATSSVRSVEGYPSDRALPMAAGAALHRTAFFQSLAGWREKFNRDMGSPAAPPPIDPDTPRPSALEASLPPELRRLLPSPSAAPHPHPRPPRATLRDAELAMLDTPHPIAVLSNTAAYGDDGSISRFHHPDHYTQSLGSVVRSNLMPLRMISARMDFTHFASLVQARLRRMHSDPAGAWHHAVWDLEAARTVRGQRLHLSPAEAAVFGEASTAAATGAGALASALGGRGGRQLGDELRKSIDEAVTWDGASAGVVESA
jgi:hypothetical protein